MDASREEFWARRLRPILPGPPALVEAQLDQRRRGTIVISALIGLIGLFLLAIFAAFGRTDIGLRVFAIELVPATAFCWLDFRSLSNRARAYLRERAEVPIGEAPPG
jgi:hypothetical protein